jgi:hypothetical protein
MTIRLFYFLIKFKYCFKAYSSWEIEVRIIGVLLIFVKINLQERISSTYVVLLFPVLLASTAFL